MRIIPVLDLKDGLVVRARAGDRAAYRPISTPLAPSADPIDVARGLFRLFPFDALYIADLDAIEERGANQETILRLAALLGEAEIWLDAGRVTRTLHPELAAHSRLRPVLGTESLLDPGDLRSADGRAILSLDFRGEAFVGPEEILDRPVLWPEDVIVMTLARVGSGGGPDTARLRQIRDRAGPDRRVHAAGGVRGTADLDDLQAMGIAGALVASSLHDGALGAADLERYALG